MHFSWFMHLFIVLLFSRHSSGNNWHSSYIDEEDESSTISIDSYEETKKPDYDEQKITKTTTEHNAHLHEDNVDYYPSHEDESEDEEDNSTTTFSSSSSDIVLTTNVITETTTSKIETTTTTTTTTISSTTDYDIDEQMFTKTTLDPQQIAFYIAKTNRERFLLQMFAITVAIGMSSLAIVLFTIHLRRKRRRYHGYRAPANTLPNKQSIHSNNLNI